MDIRNKNILITGASSGIGKALAQQLAPAANTLVLVARRKELLEDLCTALKLLNPALSVVLCANDITSGPQQLEILAKLQSQNIEVDILINNAGVGDEQYFHKSDLQKLHQIIDLNVTSVVTFTHHMLNVMMKNPVGKSIIFMGSGAGIAWMPGSAVYSASKHFITGFAMNLKSELRPYGLNVVLVTPGPVDSEFDKNAGIKNGMQGGPSQKTRISSTACAEDVMRQLQQNKSLIFPGQKLRQLMNLYINFPWFVREKLLMNDGRKFYRLNK